MNIYVGNLSYEASEKEIEELFTGFGAVTSVKIISDFDSGRSKGFAFVEMENDGEAKSAIAELDGNDLGGRPLKVNEARPKNDSNHSGGQRRF